MRALSYYTTCAESCDEANTETVLEGIGEFCEESNTLFLLPCPKCGDEMQVSGWLDECDDCGNLHYESDKCEVVKN